MRPVCAHDRRTIFLTVVQRNLHLPRFGDHVVIRKHMTITINNKSRSLPFLRNQTVEKIKRHSLGSDVHNRPDVLVIHRYIVLLFRIQRLVARSLRDLNLLIRRVYRAQRAGPVSRVIKE